MTEPARRWDIGSVTETDVVAMPLLERAGKDQAGKLQGIGVLYIHHTLSAALMAARALHRAGARVFSVLIPSQDRRGPTQTAVATGYAALGPCRYPHVASPREFAASMRKAVHSAITEVGGESEETGRPWMIVEDGGYAFPLLHDDPSLSPYLARCLGAVEQTSRGRWNDEYLQVNGVPRTPRQLKRPGLTISDSVVKLAHEAPFIAQTLADECQWLLRRDHEFIRHRRVVVLGYGNVGRPLARALQAAGAHVTVVDPAVSRLENGMEHDDLPHAMENAFLVFGSTGVSAFTPEALTRLVSAPGNTRVYLASASSKAVEFAQALDVLQEAVADPDVAHELIGRPCRVAVRTETDLGTRYRVTFPTGGFRDLVFLGSGYPVSFYPSDTHGAPNRAMDPVLTQLFLGAVGMAEGARFLTPRVWNLPSLSSLPGPLPDAWRDLLDETSLLRRWCDLNHINWERYRRLL